MLLYEFDENLPALEQENYSKIFSVIQKNCSTILDCYKQTNPKILYSGIKREKSPYFFEKSPINRQPKDVDPEIQTIVDSKLKVTGFTALRSNSIFCSSYSLQCRNYGHIYIIFPINGFGFTWSPAINDMYRSKMTGIQIGSTNYSHQSLSFDPEVFVKFWKFDHMDLIGAIKSGNEVLIHGNYIAVEPNTELADKLLEYLKT